METNQRQFSRSTLQVKALLKPTGTTEQYETRVLDLSMNGARLSPVECVRKGALCDLALVLDGGVESIVLEVSGNIIRADAEETVLAFSALELDSIPHLQELILYYSADPDKVESEFDSHIGLKSLQG